MSGHKSLSHVLNSLHVSCDEIKYGFASVTDAVIAPSPQVLGMFQESEGTTLIARQAYFEERGIAYEGPFARLTIEVHTSLELVGLTAILASQLAGSAIPANVIAAYFHDHIFVPYDLRARALQVIRQLGKDPENR